MAITASMVAELRAKTDAPMMECKKALTEADGNMEKAEEILRVKLGNKAGKAASRVTAEGVVASFIDGNNGALVEVNCETDFVSKNDLFLAFCNAVAELVVKSNPADVAAVADLPAGSAVLVMSFSHAEDLEIVAAFNTGLAEIKSNGTYGRILAAYGIQ